MNRNARELSFFYDRHRSGRQAVRAAAAEVTRLHEG
jgi:hypothetical protein